MNSKKRILVWDLPTRLFHWLLVVAVVGLVVSGKVGGNLIDWHGKIGLLVLGLVVFRLVWGIVGSTYARFCQFFPTPAKIATYLKGGWQAPGHNPLGAFSVFALLGVLIFQLLTGLVANDDIAFVGPLYDLVGRDLSNLATGWHHLSVNVLIALVVLHLAAIMFYAHVKKDNLVKPMVRGWKEVDQGESARGGGALALVVALVIALAAVFAASGVWLPEPPPPPAAVETPAW
ncbi:cytochrome b/b6 domain-containing protein [Azonexus hydrophilus]|jgi:cytochrome b|uniref:Cytochrome b/b6 domain-containing protein n=1 Tax=Azonexus hydrophilus TaxID=418702 RepID=A0ABZ2XN93_9RHOO|nr:cytochrome b/b6 domain-containing protein [Azonexus hydrophilus]MBS4017667.1 cytochrome b/b6 domain-containing protein [Dechloromonas sp.]